MQSPKQFCLLALNKSVALKSKYLRFTEMIDHELFNHRGSSVLDQRYQG